MVFSALTPKQREHLFSDKEVSQEIYNVSRQLADKKSEYDGQFVDIIPNNLPKGDLRWL